MPAPTLQAFNWDNPDQPIAVAYKEAAEKKETGQLAKRFGIVPFDVFHVTTATWAARKSTWISALNLKGEAGRDSDAADGDVQIKSYPGQERLQAMQRGAGAAPKEGMPSALAGTSIFDPVLCEIGYRWYCPKGGSILDPFAGGATRGVVAAFFGYQYTGVEIRQGQVDANRKQLEEEYKYWDVTRLFNKNETKSHKITLRKYYAAYWATEIASGSMPAEMPTPQWIVGNSTELDEVLPIGEEYDLCFSCPPYYNLEQYSTKDGDGSKAQTYPEFLEWYTGVYRQCVSRLKDGRFLIITVGDVRDKAGIGKYYNFNAHTQLLFSEKLGLHTYNQGVLYTALGSLPIRTSAAFPAGRKLGHTFQNTYIFWKGPDKSGAIKEALGELMPTEFAAATPDAGTNQNNETQEE